MTKKRKNNQSLTSVQVEKQRRDNLIDWITFYRRNIHRFVEHYFGINLYPYQKLWIYSLSKYSSHVSICSRAVGKTWILAVFACAIAVLYPNSEIVVVSSTKQQAGIIVEDKIQDLVNNYPNLAREISHITTNMNKWAVDFVNGSKIKIVASRDSARGKRATFIIFEEFRLIDKNILDSVIRPFAYVRQTPYLMKKEFSHLKEEPREIFISSAYHKSEWWFNETKKNIINLLKGHPSGFLAMDLSVAIRHGIKTMRQIRNEISKMNEIIVLEEYLNIPWGENADAYFKLSMFTQLRNISQSFYPQREDIYNERKNPFDLRRNDGEVRLVSCDIASRAGKANDLSITSCIRLNPTSKGYMRDLSYMESYPGINMSLQALRVRQIFHDFNADYLVIDIANAGISLYNDLGRLIRDDERGTEYLPLTVMDHDSLDKSTIDELRNKTTGMNALPLIYPISATARLNSEIAIEMRDKLQKKMWNFLIDEKGAEEYLMSSKYKKEFNIADNSEIRAWYLSPYLQTSLMINECIGLSMKLLSGNIKLTEASNARKDRYTSISYGNYFASLLDKDLVREGEDEDELELWESYSFIQ
jgi:hypothetical protein